MGQGLSCRVQDEHGLFTAVQFGDLELVKTLLEKDPSLIQQTTAYDRHSALHIAAANGQIEIVSMLLEDRSVNPDSLNRHKQTPLMLAAMHGKIDCVKKLIEANANILMFDSPNGRTCLHYAAYYGHSDCLETILFAARTSHVAASWGFSRFVNIRDGKGATPLHLAARQRRPQCVHMLLDSGALVCASTGGYGFPGSTPLHLAARGGSIDCIRELLAWGADRLHRDASGRIPYLVALKHKNDTCAALLNPSSAEPLVWPSPLKFISELNQDAKALLEQALMDANREREKTILKGMGYSPPSPSHSDARTTDDNISEVSETELCCICFDQVCTIEVQDCGHQMCAQCTLALCCHNKPNPTTASLSAPVCPFCRSNIAQLVVAKVKVNADDHELDLYSSPKLPKTRKSRNFSEGSSSFKGLSGVPSFGKMVGCGSGRISVGNECIIDKP
ncbi:putative transcription factor C2H2 family [Helianthus annuus]|uniref:RING-type E3 ubiquitin transferase n=1 Tax=Helianthus annuus TaxID=4232 RepID=A0A251T586_HELAN|nr:putative E3 ubiquitin-protein ligase XBAT31 [Helianthus annuus]KAF5821534.1 putative transcription factor C2H2 family [Helianthus annuus]KAJ0611190.1 putative transcription factor C2H2 family [Helianthus annuus]KAJ0622160.1 putative transcription factor C2H2 family [Helianthus annuus]KAJ0626470.1 putative transcription factor C2H2 family [Helianthus annuus]KAJ0947466.1 putative transcription factor C2H2 family [Helianthus annuus]